MRRLTVVSVIVSFLVAGTCPALSYVESSSGLSGNPALDGGRTELEFADINNDGNVDILSIGDHGNPYINTQEHGVMVWFGDGLGNWSLYQNGDFGYGGIAIGDINNDGLLDIGYGMHHNYSGVPFGDSMIEVAYGDGTGRNWTPGGPGLAPPSGTWGMFCTDFADINNDGWLDLASNTFGYGDGFRVYLNHGDGTWSQCSDAPTGNSDMDLVFGDINNDGNADIAASNQNGTVWFGDGSGNFTLAQHNLPTPSSGGVSGVALGDIDNDGAKELAYCQAGDTIEVWDWNPAGDSWQSMRGNLPHSGYQAVQLCDMNSDRLLDIVGYGSATGTVWLGDGTGNWTQTAGFTTPTSGDYQALRAGGDVDHNGYPDIVLVDDEGSWPSDHNVAHCFKEASVPISLRILASSPRGGEQFYAASVQFIDWVCAVPAPETALVRLELSTTGPSGPWILIVDALKNSGRYQWSVPASPSTNCFIRAVAETGSETDTFITPRPFTILSSLGISRNSAVRTAQSALDVQVYPNPATEVMTVRYTIASSGPATINLYDITGQLVGTLVKGYHSTGNHNLQLTANSPQQRLAAGVYVLRLDSDGYHATQKLIVE